MGSDGKEHKKYIVEYITVGHSMKVTAFDPETLREVSIVAAPRTTRKELADIAIRKLEYMIAKEKGES